MIQHSIPFFQRRIAASLTALVLVAVSGCASAVRTAEPGFDPGSAPTTGANEPIQVDRKYVVVDVETNELRFMDGNLVLWSAPVGTGTGFRLQSEDTEWKFTTPSGVMHVQFKEMEPVWVMPDWYFIENKLPIPPAESPKRKLPGGLGAAAIYLGNEIAIHGTDRPELLGQRVSHGCIRLSNANIIRLYHNVQIGTPILIRGTPETTGEEQPDSVARFTRPRSAARKWSNPQLSVPTDRLLRRLDAQLRSADSAGGWALSASALIERGLKEDSLALRGVLSKAQLGFSPERRAEYATFLADAFARGSLRTVVSMARIDGTKRDLAATAIVEATMELYHGSLDGPAAPWPTKRVPKWRLGPAGQGGWNALQEAEAAFRKGRTRGVAAQASRE